MRLRANPTKEDLIEAINVFKFDVNIFDYYRVKLIPVNGSQVWYETYCFSIDFLQRVYVSAGVGSSTTDNIEFYMSREGNVEYNVTKNQWSFELPTGKYVPQKSSKLIKQYNELRETIFFYLEKRNFYVNALIFEEFLNKDIINYIRSFL